MAVRLVVPDDYNDVYGSSQHVRPPARALRRDDLHHAVCRHVDEAVERIGDAEIIVANRERTPLNADVLDAAAEAPPDRADRACAAPTWTSRPPPSAAS